jgi:hypothetical protein
MISIHPNLQLLDHLQSALQLDVFTHQALQDLRMGLHPLPELGLYFPDLGRGPLDLGRDHPLEPPGGRATGDRVPSSSAGRSPGPAGRRRPPRVRASRRPYMTGQPRESAVRQGISSAESRASGRGSKKSESGSINNQPPPRPHIPLHHDG